ncbi:MAG: mechanosensitive ion channel family protein [Candidatus Izemoplasmatales bacterium]|nr:mechanosensitive ion channel family protein [bacterium]MDZ4197586.1 mechanosensitive ion channel family protein [Candidatus Izemoplasmatales bacterium]
MKKDHKGQHLANTRLYIVIGIVFVLLLLSIFAGVLFPGTLFAQIIDQSIGKFFNIYQFFVDHYVKLLESITIVFFVWVLEKAIVFVILHSSKHSQRAQTVGALFASIIKYSSVVVALFLILSAWNVQTQTLLAGAGILGLALSFGAQSLIEDVISGLFIIFERQFQVGDVIQIGDFRGTVVEIGIRATKFEDINGDIKILNNSDIRGAMNTSSHLSPAICDVSISYKEDIKRVESILIPAMLEIKKQIPDIVEGPIYKGVQALGESSVVIRIYSKTHDLKKYQVTRDLNRAIKLLFDENQIQIPFPQLVVHKEIDE